MRAIFLDIESTGLDVSKHFAIDIAFKIIDLSNAGFLQGSYQSLIRIPLEAWEQRNAHSIEINGYSWMEISNGKPIEQVRHEIITLFQVLSIHRGNAEFICQNPAFDRGFLTQIINIDTQEQLKWPYHWLDVASMYWTKVMERSPVVPNEISLSKNDIAKAYGLPTEKEPHKALNGVDHLILCYQAVMGVHFQE